MKKKDAEGLSGDAKGGFDADISLSRPSFPDALNQTRISPEQNGQADEASSLQTLSPTNREVDLLAKATQPVTGLRMRCEEACLF